MREARTAAGLSHPHIVPIHRVGEAGGFVFFVMSYVEGETLGERLRTRGPLPPADATRVLREVAWALAYAHGRGIVHRDVKPDNILLEAGTGRALVTDFGIAHGGEDPGPATDPGKIMGTAHFMSPEQAASEPVDGRSDIYSLGVVGYLAVSGRLPFESSNLPALLVRQATEAPPSVMRAAPGLPPALGAAIDRCLARDPADRFADGEALAAALAPAADARPALPPTLRAWLGARNPLLVPYLAWSGVFGTLTAGEPHRLADRQPARRAGGHRAPRRDRLRCRCCPIVGFHLNQARRQFRAGHTLADLRSALDDRAARAGRDRGARVETRREPPAHRGPATRHGRLGDLARGHLRVAPRRASSTRTAAGLVFILAPVLSTTGARSGEQRARRAVHSHQDPQVVADGDSRAPLEQPRWENGSRAGSARRSARTLAGASAFRATEAALGVAASELFAALPKAYREQLAELPAIVAALEARAAEARAEVEVLAALAPSGSADADVLAARKKAAATHLAESVAALEGIRLDLLRLHAGAGDLAPLTTLMDAARLAGEDVSRLAEAQREVEDAAGGSFGAERIRDAFVVEKSDRGGRQLYRGVRVL